MFLLTILYFWSPGKLVQKLNFKLQLILTVFQEIRYAFSSLLQAHTDESIYMQTQKIRYQLIKPDLDKEQIVLKTYYLLIACYLLNHLR